ncbi:MAG: cob(I)yrinic acid a,c-diamide adenosyltransferase [Bacteroidales bacterium]|nr:cob(I)yrinic acid a,c-diamide adenosyltransferase [Bacteroidales bacterium]
MGKCSIYTRSGDKGMTSLVGGKRICKTHVRLEAYGDVDELNAHIGLLRTYLADENDLAFTLWVQHKMFVIGSWLATDTSNTPLSAASCLCDNDLQRIENAIDAIDETVPKLHAFLLPGGCEGSAQCQVTRTVCRRTERQILRMAETCQVDGLMLAFMNRLSDYLFMLARKLNFQAGATEIFWDKNCK